MDARRYLQQIPNLTKQIELLEEQYETVKECASSAGAIRYDKERIQTSLIGNRLENLIIRCIELEEQIAAKKAEKKHLIQKVKKQLQCLPKSREQTVLQMKYIDDLSFNRIAKHYEVSRWTIYRWHDEAIGHFQETNFDYVS